MYYVSIFMEDRSYGGPEEGGWWYNHGFPMHSEEELAQRRVFEKREDADAYCRDLQQRLDTSGAWNRDGRNRDLGSVACCGRYMAYVTKGEPVPFPEERPIWE